MALGAWSTAPAAPFSFPLPPPPCCGAAPPLGAAAAPPFPPLPAFPASFVSAMLPAPWNRLVRLDRDPLDGSIGVPAAPDPARLSALGIDQHRLRVMNRRGKLHDSTLGG